ncbi:MAG: SDR family oxidoreductase [Glaciimonas sp.]|nr:SDR family oxidoreductase [Glaciimonas sp.]
MESTQASSPSLAGKHALVTGGGRGIGAAVAKQLLLHGARVSVVGRNMSVLANTVAELQPFGEVDYFRVDVEQRESVTQAFDQARSRFGSIAILINNAGQAASASFIKTDETIWQQMLAVNLTGTFHCTHDALPDMLSVQWGRVVNVVSTAGLAGYRYVSAYCAAKHGVIGLTRSLALEMATKGITVNAVCPGYTETDIVKNAVATIVAKTGRMEQQARNDLVAGNPQKRLVQPEEVASAVLWLCLPGSDAMTGQALAVAGGEVM